MESESSHRKYRYDAANLAESVVHLAMGTIVPIRHRVCARWCLMNGGAEAAPFAQAHHARAIQAAVAARGDDASGAGAAAVAGPAGVGQAGGAGAAVASATTASAAGVRRTGPPMSTAYGPMRRHAAAKARARQLY